MDSLEKHTQLALISFLALVFFIYVRSALSWRFRTRGCPLPPGPPPLPVIGNMFNIPRQKPWIGYRELCNKYGNIVYLRSLGQSIVVLGSPELIFQYLDKHSSNTSDRKQTAVIGLTGSEFNVGLFPHDPWWRRHRRALQQHFNLRAVQQYQSILYTTNKEFLARLLKDPSDIIEHIRFAFSASMLKVVYNIDAADENDEYIMKIDAALEAMSQGMLPGKFLVEFFPVLRHVPSWMPGAGFQGEFARWRAANLALKNEPFVYFKETMGGATNCIVGKLLARFVEPSGSGGVSHREEEEDVIKNVAATSFEAASDTMFSTLQATFLAMSLYPAVLKRAQTELDAVVGPNRLPSFEDEGSLVYVKAVIKESLRWHNVIPLGLPHCATADDQFEGYFIPAGTVLIPNVWACMHDPEVYEDPYEFRPERFIKDGKLDPDVRDPFAFVFGFGRRICPGRHFAESSLFINIASALHVFDFTPPVDSDGRPINIVPEMTDGFLSYPEDSRCAVKPRSVAAESLILSQASDDAKT